MSERRDLTSHQIYNICTYCSGNWTAFHTRVSYRVCVRTHAAMYWRFKILHMFCFCREATHISVEIMIEKKDPLV